MNKIAKGISIVFMTLTLFAGSTAPTMINTTVAHAKTTYVWIAPKHGKKWHYSKHCRGLNHASYKKHVKLHWAKKHGYTHCKFG